MEAEIERKRSESGAARGRARSEARRRSAVRGRPALLLAVGLFVALAVPRAHGFLAYDGKWGDAANGTPAIVSWGYMDDGVGIDPSAAGAGLTGTSNLSAVRADIDARFGAGSFDAAIERAFDTWAAASGITFVGPLPDNGLDLNDPEAGVPSIRVGAFQLTIGGNAAGFSPPPNGGTLAGDVVFNLDETFQIAPGIEDVTPVDFLEGNDVEGLFLHELGHALGLLHPVLGEPGTDVMSVMYVGAGCCTAINRELAQDDIDGAQFLYGPPVARGDRLPVLNPGFEEPRNFVPGGFLVNAATTAWRVLDPNALIGLGFNHYGTQWPSIPEDYAADPPEGRQTYHIWLEPAQGAGEVAIEQTVPADLLPGQRYELDVAVGNFGAPFFDGFPGARIELRAGGTLLASDDGIDPADGTFADAQLAYTPAAGSSGVCEPIEIRLVHRNAAPGTVIDFDDVELRALPATVHTYSFDLSGVAGSVAGRFSYDEGAGASQAVPGSASVVITAATGALADLAGLAYAGGTVEEGSSVVLRDALGRSAITFGFTSSVGLDAPLPVPDLDAASSSVVLDAVEQLGAADSFALAAVPEDDCGSPRDTDEDGTPDAADNCIDQPNAGQEDVDEDGFGNACDGDFNQDDFIGGPDFDVFLQCFNRAVSEGVGPPDDPNCEESDMNSDGFVGGPDFDLFLQVFNQPPGPGASGCGLGFELVALLAWPLARRARSGSRRRR